MEFGSDVSLEGMISVGVLQQCDETFNDELGIECGYPVVLDSLGADFTCILLDVGVIDASLEVDLGGLERVVV